MPSFVSGIQFQNGRGQQVRSGVAVDLQRFGILAGQDLEVGVGLQRTREVVEFAVDLGDDGGVSQTGADGLCDIDGAGAGGHRCYCRRAE